MHDVDCALRFSEQELTVYRERAEQQISYYKDSPFRLKSATLVKLLLNAQELKEVKEKSAYWSCNLVPLYREFGSMPENLIFQKGTSQSIKEFFVKLSNYLRDNLGLKFIWRNPEFINYRVDFDTARIMLIQIAEGVNFE